MADPDPLDFSTCKHLHSIYDADRLSCNEIPSTMDRFNIPSFGCSLNHIFLLAYDRSYKPSFTREGLYMFPTRRPDFLGNMYREILSPIQTQGCYIGQDEGFYSQRSYQWYKQGDHQGGRNILWDCYHC
jgi:hypothetical protein